LQRTQRHFDENIEGYSVQNVYVTQSSNVGAKCFDWVKRQNIDDIILVDSIDEADYIFSVFHNKIFRKNELSDDKIFVNFHGGILPEYRGSCTINWAIINEEDITGVTLHLIDSGIDTGPVIDISTVKINHEDTSETVYSLLEDEVYRMFKYWFDKILTGDYIATDQSCLGRTYKRIDIEKAKDLTRFVRAFEHKGKESAYYYTKSGHKKYLIYDDL